MAAYYGDAVRRQRTGQLQHLSPKWTNLRHSTSSYVRSSSKGGAERAAGTNTAYNQTNPLAAPMTTHNNQHLQLMQPNTTTTATSGSNNITTTSINTSTIAVNKPQRLLPKRTCLARSTSLHNFATSSYSAKNTLNTEEQGRLGALEARNRTMMMMGGAGATANNTKKNGSGGTTIITRSSSKGSIRSSNSSRTDKQRYGGAAAAAAKQGWALLCATACCCTHQSRHGARAALRDKTRRVASKCNTKNICGRAIAALLEMALARTTFGGTAQAAHNKDRPIGAAGLGLGPKTEKNHAMAAGSLCSSSECERRKACFLGSLLVLVFIVIPAFYGAVSGPGSRFHGVDFAHIPLDRYRTHSVAQRFVHLDLKGLPPKPDFLIALMSDLADWGATGIVIEWEDMLPYYDDFRQLRSPTAYSEEDVRSILAAASDAHLEVVPLIPTFAGLEFVLSRRSLAFLREAPEELGTICPTRARALPLIADLVLQVLQFHPNARTVHLGGHAPGTIGVCRSCALTELSTEMLYLRHMVPILDFVRKRKLRALMWDSAVRDFEPSSLQVLADTGVELVLRSGAPDLQHLDALPVVRNYVWSTYQTIFDNRLWAGPAFRGADGDSSDFVPIAARIANVVNWLKLTTLNPVNGVILTGFARSGFFSPLRESLPAAVPALAMCLRTLEAGFFDAKLRNETLDLLGMPLSAFARAASVSRSTMRLLRATTTVAAASSSSTHGHAASYSSIESYMRETAYEDYEYEDDMVTLVTAAGSWEEGLMGQDIVAASASASQQAELDWLAAHARQTRSDTVASAHHRALIDHRGGHRSDEEGYRGTHDDRRSVHASGDVAANEMASNEDVIEKEQQEAVTSSVYGFLGEDVYRFAERLRAVKILRRRVHLERLESNDPYETYTQSYEGAMEAQERSKRSSSLEIQLAAAVHMLAQEAENLGNVFYHDDLEELVATKLGMEMHNAVAIDVAALSSAARRITTGKEFVHVSAMWLLMAGMPLVLACAPGT